jgi:hypothetical protein
MEYGNMLGESFAYAKEGVVNKMNKWIMLIIATIILTIPLMGYLMQICRGTKPAPEVGNWGKLFIDGIMLAIVAVIYMIPIFILTFLMFGAAIVGAIFEDPTAVMAGMAAAGILFLVYIIVAIIIGLIAPMAMIRFARSGSIGEAFNFNAIRAHIGKIGWINYIIALIILDLVILVIGIPVGIILFVLLALTGILTVALSEIGFLLGGLISVIVVLALIPVITVFLARYITQIYDTVAA